MREIDELPSTACLCWEGLVIRDVFLPGDPALKMSLGIRNTSGIIIVQRRYRGGSSEGNDPGHFENWESAHRCPRLLHRRLEAERRVGRGRDNARTQQRWISHRARIQRNYSSTDPEPRISPSCNGRPSHSPFTSMQRSRNTASSSVTALSRSIFFTVSEMFDATRGTFSFTLQLRLAESWSVTVESNWANQPTSILLAVKAIGGNSYLQTFGESCLRILAVSRGERGNCVFSIYTYTYV